MEEYEMGIRKEKMIKNLEESVGRKLRRNTTRNSLMVLVGGIILGGCVAGNALNGYSKSFEEILYGVQASIDRVTWDYANSIKEVEYWSAGDPGCEECDPTD